MSIATSIKYAPILDQLYKQESKTAALDLANDMVKFDGTPTVKLYSMADLHGLADYSRSTGYVNGTVNTTWETYTLAKDRGISFTVDAMDDEESLGMAFGRLSSEFIRTQVVPEIDAYRFATYASKAGILGDAADIVVGTTDVASLVDNAESAMSDAEVPEDGRILFISEKAYAAMKNKIQRTILNGEDGIAHDFETYDGMRVIRVPAGRFNTAITLNSGASSFGFEPTAGGYAINFMIVAPSAVMQIAKHVEPRIFSPAENQTADAYKFNYRIYHDAFVLDNKVKGIYCHKASTANA